MAASINVTGSSTSPNGTVTLAIPQENLSTPVLTVNQIPLSSGANTIAVPSGATCVIVQPPLSNTVLITLKGITGDTGVALHKTLATGPINLDSTQTSFVLTAASAITALTTITFI